MNEILQRITINNILAFMIVGVYSGMWAFTLFYGVTMHLTEGEDPIISILGVMEQMATILTTMTIIVVLVVQFYFRTSPSIK